jgi:hypothetical protein
MATVEACRGAIADLAALLESVEPELRAKHVPDRVVACRLSDLGCWFVGSMDEHGVHDVTETDGAEPQADVRLTMTSDELVALSRREDDFLHAWLRGRIQVSASVRDLLRLRSFFGL